jgi:hypothetical protein
MKAKLSMLALSFFLAHVALAQEKIAIAVGAGFPELLNAGIRVNGKQTQFGVTFGIFPSKTSPARALSADLYVHFGGLAKLTPRKPWFLKFSLSHFHSESTYLIENYGYFNPGVGREMNISKKFGVEVHAGTAIQVYEDVVNKQVSGWDMHITIPVLPSFGVAAFYKI